MNRRVGQKTSTVRGPDAQRPEKSEQTWKVRERQATLYFLGRLAHKWFPWSTDVTTPCETQLIFAVSGASRFFFGSSCGSLLVTIFPD